MAEPRQHMRDALAALMAVATIVIAGRPAQGHPGPLDSKGCHHVRTPLTSKDGAVGASVGDYHCHRGLGGGKDGESTSEAVREKNDQKGMKLDGLERLEDEKHNSRERAQ